jgi:hypothetical protein
VDQKLLQGSLSWKIKYLGRITKINDWQILEDRTVFMNLIDDSQMDGSINWFSNTPKLLHVSPMWVHVTDQKKKVLN